MELKDGEKPRIGCVRKGNNMSIKQTGFTTEERAKQLKDCCQTIIDNAEKIMEGIDLSVDKTITISFPSNEIPRITVEQTSYSKKMLDRMIGK